MTGDDFTSVENYIVDDETSVANAGNVTVSGNNASFNTHIEGTVDTSGEGNNFTNVEVGNDFIVSGGSATVSDATVGNDFDVTGGEATAEDTTIEKAFNVSAGAKATVKGNTSSESQDFQGTVDVSEANNDDIIAKGEEANDAADEAAVNTAIAALNAEPEPSEFNNVKEGANVVAIAEEIIEDLDLDVDVTVELNDTYETTDNDVIATNGDAIGAAEGETTVKFDVTAGETTVTSNAIKVIIIPNDSNQEAIDAVNEAEGNIALNEALDNELFNDISGDARLSALTEELDNKDSETVAEINALIDLVNDAFDTVETAETEASQLSDVVEEVETDLGNEDNVTRLTSALEDAEEADTAADTAVDKLYDGTAKGNLDSDLEAVQATVDSANELKATADWSATTDGKHFSAVDQERSYSAQVKLENGAKTKNINSLTVKWYSDEAGENLLLTGNLDVAYYLEEVGEDETDVSMTLGWTEEEYNQDGYWTVNPTEDYTDGTDAITEPLLVEFTIEYDNGVTVTKTNTRTDN
ncbi:hypothetical protein EU245_12375 [Lentibacillus lipolyticus]|nr:hypothetical protein EU245_12375 [Lentibacillus lipolyticus]